MNLGWSRAHLPRCEKGHAPHTDFGFASLALVVSPDRSRLLLLRKRTNRTILWAISIDPPTDCGASSIPPTIGREPGWRSSGCWLIIRRRVPMRFRTLVAFLAIAWLTAGFASAKDSPDQQREKIR